MGYDPEKLDKNKKVMYSKTNAFKNWQQSHQEEVVKGTQDLDTHLSPGATARE